MGLESLNENLPEIKAELAFTQARTETGCARRCGRLSVCLSASLYVLWPSRKRRLGPVHILGCRTTAALAHTEAAAVPPAALAA